MKILVVDDVADNAELLNRFLKRRGHDVLIASNGLEAVQMTREHRPGLVFMDISMPVMSGLDATREIRADETVAHTPVVALTAHAMASDREACLAAGCDDVATKPVEFGLLNEIVKRYDPDQQDQPRVAGAAG